MTNNELGPRHHLRTDVSSKPKGASADDICDVEDFAAALVRFDNDAPTIYTEMCNYMVDITPQTNNLKVGKTGFAAEIQHFVD